jgi:hypothetical protein
MEKNQVSIPDLMVQDRGSLVAIRALGISMNKSRVEKRRKKVTGDHLCVLAVAGENRVARVTCPGRTGSPKVIGRVGTTECEMTIDSGALIVMVRADLVRVEKQQWKQGPAIDIIIRAQAKTLVAATPREATAKY